jgi:hypothetical protein
MAIQNPGSAIGEAIGSNMEKALNRYLQEFVKNYSCHLISRGEINPKTGKYKKLLLSDNFGTDYNIDAVITNESLQPIILIEYKYIRYKKHNRDKGSWLCTAHTAIRRRYSSIRSSIAILAGNWSGSSLAMMKSHDVTIFLIPFETICELLNKHGIQFDWGEKDRGIAQESWNQYERLSENEKLAVGVEMTALIKNELEDTIEKILDDTIDREVKKVVLELHTNIGEVKKMEFENIEDAMDFLSDFKFEVFFDTSNSLSLFENN